MAFCLLQSLCAQIKLVDSLTQEPVVAVNVFSIDGVLLGVSDAEGQVNLDNLHGKSENSVTVQHVAYQNKKIPDSTLFSMDTIYLVPRNFEIGEVTIMDRSKFDYVMLKGYFRKQDLLNNATRYFYDGIVEYYIPLKKKGRIENRLLQYRLFANSKSLDEYIQLMGKTFSDPPSLIGLSPESIMNDLPKGTAVVTDHNKLILQKDGVHLGFIQQSKNGNVQVYFDKVPPQKVVNRRLFRIKGKTYRALTMENYVETDLDKPEVENLVSKIRSNVGAIQRKTEDGFIPMESFSEFYVMERSYLTVEDIKEMKDLFTKSSFLEEHSNYQEKFWLDLDRYDIPPLAEGIANQLGKELKER